MAPAGIVAVRQPKLWLSDSYDPGGPFHSMITLLIAILLSFNPCAASTLRGYISTSPTPPPLATTTPPVFGNTGTITSTSGAGGGAFISNLNAQKKNKASSSEDVRVLGVSFIPDDTLVRGGDKRIFILRAGCRRQIRNLAELKNHRGQAILDILPEELESYESKSVLVGDVFKIKGEKRLYVLRKNGPEYVADARALDKLKPKAILEISPEGID